MPPVPAQPDQEMLPAAAPVYAHRLTLFRSVSIPHSRIKSTGLAFKLLNLDSQVQQSTLEYKVSSTVFKFLQTKAKELAARTCRLEALKSNLADLEQQVNSGVLNPEFTSPASKLFPHQEETDACTQAALNFCLKRLNTVKKKAQVLFDAYCKEIHAAEQSTLNLFRFETVLGFQQETELRQICARMLFEEFTIELLQSWQLKAMEDTKKKAQKKLRFETAKEKNQEVKTLSVKEYNNILQRLGPKPTKISSRLGPKPKSKNSSQTKKHDLSKSAKRKGEENGKSSKKPKKVTIAKGKKNQK